MEMEPNPWLEAISQQQDLNDSDDEGSQRWSEVVKFLSQQDEDLLTLPPPPRSHSGSGSLSLILCAALRCGDVVFEVHRGAGDEAGRSLARELTQTRALATSQRFRATGDTIIGVARIVDIDTEEKKKIRAVAIIVIEASSNALANRVVAASEAQRLAEELSVNHEVMAQAVQARIGDNYALEAVNAQLRSILRHSFLVDHNPIKCECKQNLVSLLCTGSACGTPLCAACGDRCEVCRKRLLSRNEILSQASLPAFLETIGDHFGDFSSIRGLISRAGFARLLCSAAGVDDHEDPILLNTAFDSADADGDGCLDFADLVRWLQHDGLRSCCGSSLIVENNLESSSVYSTASSSGGTVEFITMPRVSSTPAMLRGHHVDISLCEAKLRLYARGVGARVATVHPSVFSVQRPAATRLQVSAPLGEAQIETLELSFLSEEDCALMLTALSDTLALCARLRGSGTALLRDTGADPRAPLFRSAQRSACEEVGLAAVAQALGNAFVAQDQCSHSRTSSLSSSSSAGGLCDDEDERPGQRHRRNRRSDPRLSGSLQHRRRSVRFSDADEIEVSRGYAFDRIKTADGQVKWEASAPRRAKEAYRAVVKLVIRPPRAEYCIDELGPRTFEIRGPQDTMLSNLGQENGTTLRSISCLRTDFEVVSVDDRRLSCSLWTRLEDVIKKESSRPLVLYSHGNASCRLEALPHVAPLLILGISIAAFDASGSGHSDGEYVTLGHRESADVAAVGRHLIATGRATKIALFGRSMGGVASILSASRHADFGGVAKCVVADSPFATLNGLVDDLARNAACTAFRAPKPADLAEMHKPIDATFVANANGLAQASSRAPLPRSPASDIRGHSHIPNTNDACGTEPSSWLSAFPNVTTALNARSSLAEAAARAAIDSVRNEVIRRAGFDVDEVNTLNAIDSLDCPLLLIAAENDTLIPARANAGRLLERYFQRRNAVTKRSLKQRLEAQLVLVKGSHNAKRPALANRKAYYFLCRHLLDLRETPKVLRDKLQILNAFPQHLGASAMPWQYSEPLKRALASVPRVATPPLATATATGEDAPYVSGMTESRQRKAMHAVTNLFT